MSGSFLALIPRISR